MKSLFNAKRVAALALSLSLLCGLMLGNLALPAAAAETVEPAEVSKFAVDFSDLAALAEAGGAFEGDVTYIKPGYTTALEKEIAAWVNERFDMVSGYGRNMVRTTLGQNSSTLIISKDTWSGNNYWNLMKSGYIQHKTSNSGQAYRLVESFVPKFKGEQAVLANFEAKLTFSVAAPGSNPHGILVAFHEKTAGFTRANGDHALHANTGNLVMINNGAGSYTKASGFGMAIYDQNNTNGADGAAALPPASAIVDNEKAGATVNHNYYANHNIDGEVFENQLVGNTAYDLIVRVVGTKVTATVKDMDGNVMYTREKTLNKAGEGYISFGSSNAANRFFAIEVTELDEEGNPVDFGTKTLDGGVETLKVDFDSVPEAQYYNGKYYYDATNTEADASVSPDMNTAFLTAGSTSYTIGTQDAMLVDYLEEKLAFYYSQEGNAFQRFDVNGYAVNADGVEHTGKGTANTFFAPDTKVSVGNYVDGIGSAGNSGNGIGKWYLDGNKWLTYTHRNGDHSFRTAPAVALRDLDGDLLQIDNFKLDLDFKLYADGTSDYNFMAIGFRSDNPYMKRTITTQAMFALSPYGGYFLGDDDDYALGGLSEDYYIFNKSNAGAAENKYYDPFTADYATYSNSFASYAFMRSANQKNIVTSTNGMVWPNVAAAIGNNAEAHLTLTVVGNTVTAKVTKGETVILEETTTIARDGAGYLTIGGSNRAGWFANIEVTRLDVNGDAVDFSDDNEGFDFGASFDAPAVQYEGKFYRDTGADMFWLQGAQTTYYTFDDATYATDVKTAEELKEKFDFYAYFGGKLGKMTEPYQTSEQVGATDSWANVGGAANYARWYYTKDGLAMKTGNDKIGGGEVLRKGVTLSPKIDDELIYARNVEVYTDITLTANNDFSAMNLTLRGEKEGTVITGNNDTNNKYANQLTVQLTRLGVNISDGVRVPQTASSIKAAPGYTAYADGAEHTRLRVYAKADNFKLTVKVTDLKTGATLYEVTNKQVAYVDEGYIVLSTGQGISTVANMYVNVLEDTMTPAFEAKYTGMFAYNSLGNADERIPEYLRQAKNLNGYDYFGTWANNYTHEKFKNVHNTFAVADGYTVETVGEGDEAVKNLMKDGEIVLSTAEAWIDDFKLNENAEDASLNTYSIVRNQAYLNQIVKDLSTEFYNYLDSKFDSYYIDTTLIKGAGAADNGWGAEAASVYVNEYLQFSGLAAASAVNSYMKQEDHTPIDQHLSVLVPKNADGTRLMGQNFELSQRVRLSDSENYGTAYIGFNMPKAGDLGASATSNAPMDFNADVNVIKINKSEFKLWNGTEWVDLVADYVGANHFADITLKVLDGKLTGTVQFGGKTAQAFEVELTNTDAGYFAIAHNGGSVNFGKTYIQVYDALMVEEHTCDFATAKYDENGHWNECECGEKDEVKAHVFDNDCDTTCACGYVREVADHDYATTDFDENGHWTVCACGAATEAAAHVFDNACDTDCACGYTRVTEHNYATTEYDENGHWTVCACGAATEAAAHVFDNACDTDCACGYTRVTEHNYATTEYDENGHWTVCACGAATEAAAHEFDNDCDTACDCGYTRTIEHDFATAKYDETNHWNECACGDKADVAAHEFDNDCDTACDCGYTRTITHNFATPNFDENNHWNECACGEKANVTAHTMNGKHSEEGHWTACNCGYATALTAHSMDVKYDFNGHWTECACGYKTEAENHTLTLVNNGDTHYAECACGYKTEGFAHDFTDGDCACGEQKPNTAVVKENKIVVKLAEGTELKAGTLVLVDSLGNEFVPQRVGYREGGNGLEYAVPAGAVGDITIKAEFYQPTLDDLNMGLLGTSFNAGRSGLRYVHRVNVVKEGNELYMTANGGKVEIAEYGMLLASGSLLKDGNDLDVETAQQSKHVLMYTWTADSNTKFYDYCEDYTDIAVHVVNIKTDKYDGSNTPIHCRTYVKLADGTIIHGEVASYTYNQVAGA